MNASFCVAFSTTFVGNTILTSNANIMSGNNSKTPRPIACPATPPRSTDSKRPPPPPTSPNSEDEKYCSPLRAGTDSRRVLPCSPRPPAMQAQAAVDKGISQKYTILLLKKPKKNEEVTKTDAVVFQMPEPSGQTVYQGEEQIKLRIVEWSHVRVVYNGRMT